MTYKLTFHPAALKEWKKLNPHIQSQFKAKLKERLNHPDVKKDKLRGSLKNCYKIKLRQVGYRLVYQINEKQITLLVIGVGKREAEAVYDLASKRF